MDVFISCFSTDESATEAILKSQQIFASLCGRLALNTPRDAFITALCKASLPPHYALTVLNSQGGIAALQKCTYTKLVVEHTSLPSVVS